VRRVTADSNIYISALNHGGKPLQLLELARHGQIQIAVSAPILTEVVRVLDVKFHWTADDIHEARERLSGFTTLVVPTETLDAVPDDADDNRVLECAVAAGSDTVVSGDLDLLRLASFRGIVVMKVAEFLAEFEPSSG
jgi:putative PIN family toxin of toxin-antitoxin system